MTYMVDIDNVVNEDTGEIGTVHIRVDSETEGRELIALIIAEEDGDPADFRLVPEAEWSCVDCQPKRLMN